MFTLNKIYDTNEEKGTTVVRIARSGSVMKSGLQCSNDAFFYLELSDVSKLKKGKELKKFTLDDFEQSTSTFDKKDDDDNVIGQGTATWLRPI